MRVLILLASLVFSAPHAFAIQSAQQPTLTPLSEIIDADRKHFNAVGFIGQFNSLCRGYGQTEFDKALAPFKDSVLLNIALENAKFNEQFTDEIFSFLARIFWQGMCVEKDEDAAYAVMRDQAFHLGMPYLERAWQERPEVRAFYLAASEDYYSSVTDKDYRVPEVTDRGKLPPWTQNSAGQIDLVDTAPLALQDQTVDTALGSYILDYWLGRYANITPVQQEAKHVQQLANLGLHGPLRIALTLRQRKTVLANPNTLALRWLEFAKGSPFKDPAAIHTLALWHRDRVFHRLQGEELDEEMDYWSLMNGNDALSFALELGDTKLLPLAYCLIDYETSRAVRNYQLGHGPKLAKEVAFIEQENVRRREFLYKALTLMKDLGIPHPEGKLDQLEDQTSFMTRLWTSLTLEMSDLDLDPDLLPDKPIDLAACAQETGQTEFWQEQGLIEAPGKYWLGPEVATVDRSVLRPIERLFNESRWKVKWLKFMVRAHDYCETYDKSVMDRYLSPYKDLDRLKASFLDQNDFMVERSVPPVRAMLAALYLQGECVPKDQAFVDSVTDSVQKE